MKKLIILVIFVLYIATSAQTGCKSYCASRALIDNDFSFNERCVRACRNEEDDTAETLNKLDKLKEILLKEVQPVDTLQELENIKADPKPGDKLQATDGLNVRDGPCTDRRVITTIPAGTVVTYAGSSTTACGYKWYKISGGFGTGFAASNWLAPVGGGCKAPFNAPLYKQCDSRWGNDKLGSSSTICKVGCLMTSVSMAMNGLGKKINGQSVTPKNFNQFLLSNGGYSGNLYVWGAISRFGFKYQGQPTNIQTIKNYVCSRAVVILNIDKGGHWVLATGVNGNTFTINDPGRTRSSVSASEVLRAGVYTY